MTTLDAQSRDSSAQFAERVALANRFLDAIQFDHAEDRMFSAAAPASDDPMSSGQISRDLRLFLKKYMTPEKVRPEITRAYAEQYTTDELRQLIAFFESPLGKEYIEKRAVIGEVGRIVIGRLMTEHQEEFRRTVLRVPEIPEVPDIPDE